MWTPLPDGWIEATDPASKRPYYFHKASGQKSWQRPTDVCAYVTSKKQSTAQPVHVAPRRASSRALLMPSPSPAPSVGITDLPPAAPPASAAVTTSA